MVCLLLNSILHLSLALPFDSTHQHLKLFYQQHITHLHSLALSKLGQNSGIIWITSFKVNMTQFPLSTGFFYVNMHLDQGFECDNRQRYKAGFVFKVCCSTLSWPSWDWSSSVCCWDCSRSAWASISWDWASISCCSRRHICNKAKQIIRAHLRNNLGQETSVNKKDTWWVSGIEDRTLITVFLKTWQYLAPITPP